jgi:hydrogenase expression/formation protein HypE
VTAAPFTACPLPVAGSAYDRIVLGHGAGGRLSRELVDRVFVPAFANPALAALADAAVVDTGGAGRLAITTDAFVVDPIVFPGGDIGTLAMCGTINDLAVTGAEPRWLTAAFVIEEGLPIAVLERVVASMRAVAIEAGVAIVAGDTKVVERGKADELFITTTGVGVVPAGRDLGPHAIRPGDQVIVSGTIGDHGVAILAVRAGIELDTALASDCAPLIGPVRALLAAVPDVRCMRDPTRGGVSAALTELASAGAGTGIRLREAALPVHPAVRGACELLGLDPLYVANEGKLIAIVPAASAARAVAALREHPLGRDAQVIGEVVADHPGVVVVESVIGGERVVPMLAGDQLPRIC